MKKKLCGIINDDLSLFTISRDDDAKWCILVYLAVDIKSAAEKGLSSSRSYSVSHIHSH